MKIAAKALAGLAALSYPVLIYWGLQHPSANYWLVAGLLVVIILRKLAGGSSNELKIMLLALVGVISLMIMMGENSGFKFYPVLVNSGFLLLFASSLLSPQSIIERIAKPAKDDVAAVQYMRNLTKIWSLFFFLNGSIALLVTLFGTNEQWLFYNGFLSYLLIALLAGGEWLYRRKAVH